MKHESGLVVAQRKKAIPDAEWEVKIALRVADEQIGGDLVLRYGDSYLAKLPNEVGRLIAEAMQERAGHLTPKKRRSKR